jgi:hypothetical protein
MSLSPRPARLALALLVTALAASPAAAELAKWDQARVTGIAKQLADASEAWWMAVREQPDIFGEALEPKAQVLKEQSRALAGHLEKGKGHDQTRGMYLSLKESIDDSEVEAQRAELEEQSMAAWAKVADLWRQLSPYYDPKALDETGSQH